MPKGRVEISQLDYAAVVRMNQAPPDRSEAEIEALLLAGSEKKPSALDRNRLDAAQEEAFTEGRKRRVRTNPHD